MIRWTSPRRRSRCWAMGRWCGPSPPRPPATARAWSRGWSACLSTPGAARACGPWTSSGPSPTRPACPATGSAPSTSTTTSPLSRCPKRTRAACWQPSITRHCAASAWRSTWPGPTSNQPSAVSHPLVYAEWLEASGCPTLLIYGHYDVQPPDPLELWQTPPFEPAVRGDDLYARGASDDKGQMLALLKGVEAVLQTQGRLPANLKV